MNRKIFTITEKELDALLSGNPVGPENAFVEKTLIKAAPVTENELNLLLSGTLPSVSPDFTERTLARIEKHEPGGLLEFPVARWLVRSGMAVAVLAAGLFSYSIWIEQNPPSPTASALPNDLTAMDLEELLYLEETLSSAKVLIELEKTVPLYYLFEEADS